MAKRSFRVSFGRKDRALYVNKLSQTRLSLAVGIITASRADEENIGYACFLGSICKLHGDVKLVAMSGRNQADGVASNLLESLDHEAFAAWLMMNDFPTKFREFLGSRGRRIQCQAGETADLSGKFTLFQEKLGYEKTCLAFDGRDADIPRHFNDGSMWFDVFVIHFSQERERVLNMENVVPWHTHYIKTAFIRLSLTVIMMGKWNNPAQKSNSH
jgi:hypothetical protein